MFTKSEKLGLRIHKPKDKITVASGNFQSELHADIN